MGGPNLFIVLDYFFFNGPYFLPQRFLPNALERKQIYKNLFNYYSLTVKIFQAR